MDKNDDQIWLDVLAGKTVSTSNKKIVLNAKLLRSAIKEHITEEKIHKDGLNRLLVNLHHKGLLGGQHNKNFRQKFFDTISKLRLLIIFVIGLMAGTSLPIVLTRGGSHTINFDLPYLYSSQIIHEANEIEREVEDPIAFSREVTLSALAAGMTVKINGDYKDIYMVITGFRKNDSKFFVINSMLQLTNETEGQVVLHLKKK